METGNDETNCQRNCGSVCCYVDDSTFTISGKDPEILSLVLSRKYQRLSNFFGSNGLVINDSKTQLIIAGPRKQAYLRERIIVNTGSTNITPVENARLLGLEIHQSLKWKEHLQNNQNSMTSSLAKRINAFKRIANNASFKTRLNVANACFMSTVTYMIVVWGGTESYLIKSIQVMQNRVARYVTKLSWFTPTRTLLKQCNWMSIKQLIFFHTVIQLWKVRKAAIPVGLNAYFTQAQTRSGLTGTLAIPQFNSSLARKSFLVRAPLSWNMIPSELRSIQEIRPFKSKLRAWIMENIECD